MFNLYVRKQESMNFANSRSFMLFCFALVSFNAMANSLTNIGCYANATPAKLALEAEAWTSSNDKSATSCPLLEKKRLRKLVDRFGAGTTFAHPVIPGFCLSGKVTSGTLALEDGTEFEIDPTTSYSESAQRLFPVPPVPPVLPIPGDPGGVDLFAIPADESLQVGAAMTALYLEGTDASGTFMKLYLLLDDRFLVKTLSGEDAEDFHIVGSKGAYKVRGRLAGHGNIVGTDPLHLSFKITGLVCLK